jgi:hypothetical protein
MSRRNGRESFHHIAHETIAVMAPAERADGIFAYL